MPVAGLPLAAPQRGAVGGGPSGQARASASAIDGSAGAIGGAGGNGAPRP